VNRNRLGIRDTTIWTVMLGTERDCACISQYHRGGKTGGLDRLPGLDSPGRLQTDSFNSKHGTRRKFQIQRPQPDAAAETHSGGQAAALQWRSHAEALHSRAAPVAHPPHNFKAKGDNMSPIIWHLSTLGYGGERLPSSRIFFSEARPQLRSGNATPWESSEGRGSFVTF
jgi:hypothetical protein